MKAARHQKNDGALARKRRLESEYEKVNAKKENLDKELRNVCEDIARYSEWITGFKKEKDAREEGLQGLAMAKAAGDKIIRVLEDLSLSFKTKRDLIERMCDQQIKFDPVKMTEEINELTARISQYIEESKIVANLFVESENQIRRLNMLICENVQEFSKHEVSKNCILERRSRLLGELDLIAQELKESKDLLGDS